MTKRYWAVLAALVALLAGCQKHSESFGYDDYANALQAGAYASAEDFYGDESSGELGRALLSERSRVESKAYKTDGSPNKAPLPQQQAVAGQDRRMVHYSGDVTLRVARLQDGMDAVEQLAADFGGTVEQVYGQAILIRVPVEHFQEAFDAVLGLGEVVDRRISAADVSESFQATELRLKTAQATLERLQALLAQVTEEEEKLRLLREIQRLREEVDELEGQARTLSALASMSRISVSLVPREALAWQGAEDETAELAWVRRLSPFATGITVHAWPLRVAAPEGLVALSRRGPFLAESADGTRLWTHRVVNTPVGDAAFWLDAIEGRLSRDFGDATQSTMGDWQVLRLEDRSDAPYAWWVAVRVQGRKLHVTQAFFPDLEQEARYRAGIEALLAGGGVS